ncbi:unnamed protein product [Arctogadus glacialis]
MSLSPDVLFHTGGLEVFTRMDENLAELDIIDEFITENKDSGQEGRPRSHLPASRPRLPTPRPWLTPARPRLPAARPRLPAARPSSTPG